LTFTSYSNYTTVTISHTDMAIPITLTVGNTAGGVKFMNHEGAFCTCYDMARRVTPTSKRDKEKLKLLRRFQARSSITHRVDAE